MQAGGRWMSSARSFHSVHRLVSNLGRRLLLSSLRHVCLIIRCIPETKKPGLQYWVDSGNPDVSMHFNDVQIFY